MARAALLVLAVGLVVAAPASGATAVDPYYIDCGGVRMAAIPEPVGPTDFDWRLRLDTGGAQIVEASWRVQHTRIVFDGNRWGYWWDSDHILGSTVNVSVPYTGIYRAELYFNTTEAACSAFPDFAVLPTVSFTATPDASDPLLVRFDGSATFSPAGVAITDWQWGGGSVTGEDPVVSHRFPEPGVYRVRLTATDAHFATGRSTQWIAIGESSPAPGDPAPPPGNAPLAPGEPGPPFDGTPVQPVELDPRCGRTGGQSCPRRAFSFDYSMPDRYPGVDSDRDGMLDYPKGRQEVSPAHFDVDLQIPPHLCPWIGSANVEVAGKPQRVAVNGCRLRIQVADEGAYRVKIEIPTQQEVWVANRVVPVQDWLIFSLGDSVASGEGNPDLPAGAGRNVARWQLDRCHRSAFARASQMAWQLEARDPRTSVTFVNLACSGATIPNGMIGSFTGVAPDGGRQAAQLHEIAKLTDRGRRGPREIDAVITSVGANDIGFGKIVQFCLVATNCQDQAPYSSSGHLGIGTLGKDGTLRQELGRALADLPRGYAHLAAWFDDGSSHIPHPSRVYMTEYFDPTRAADGSVCSIGAPDARIVAALLAVPGAGALGGTVGISPSESAWASQNVVAPLNRHVQQASARHGWRYVGGIAAEFQNGHGVCAGPQSFVQTFPGSWSAHGEVPIGARLAGAVHPNYAGHLATSHKILGVLLPNLYPGGKARLPGAARVEPRVPKAGLTARNERVPLQLSCPQGGGRCTGTVELAAALPAARAVAATRRRAARRIRLARTRFRLADGTRASINVRLNRRARKLMRSRRRVRVSIQIASRDATGTRADVTVSTTLRRR